MKSRKKIVMSVTSCENPTDGRRRAELVTESKYFCEQLVGVGGAPFTFYLKEDCIPNQKVKEFAKAAEMLWVTLANVSGGDWTKQSTEWQEAANKWRDNYLKRLKELDLKE